MNSADDRLFDPARHPRRPFLEDGELRLIHHSSLQPIYGLPVAVDAVGQLRPVMEARLDVYGDGPYRSQVEEEITRLGVGDRVTLHGRVPMDELPGLLAGADIALVPSLPEPYMHYSLSTKLLEAVAMGVPVIATDLATFRSHFSETAIRYVPGGDATALAAAIRELAADPDGAARQAVEARRQAEPPGRRSPGESFRPVGVLFGHGLWRDGPLGSRWRESETTESTQGSILCRALIRSSPFTDPRWLWPSLQAPCCLASWPGRRLPWAGASSCL